MVFWVRQFAIGRWHITPEIGAMKTLCGTKIHVYSRITQIREEMTYSNTCNVCLGIHRKVKDPWQLR